MLDGQLEGTPCHGRSLLIALAVHQAPAPSDQRVGNDVDPAGPSCQFQGLLGFGDHRRAVPAEPPDPGALGVKRRHGTGRDPAGDRSLDRVVEQSPGLVEDSRHQQPVRQARGGHSLLLEVARLGVPGVCAAPGFQCAVGESCLLCGTRQSTTDEGCGGSILGEGECPFEKRDLLVM